MHIVFGNITRWQLPLLTILKYFNFKVFYLYIDVQSDIKKNKIANKLKEKNIFPLPIELEKKLSGKATSALSDFDPDEIGYKKNLKLAPDEILKKYCNLFSIDEKNIKKLRLVLQDVIFSQQMSTSGRLGIWAALYPSKKIIYVSFETKSFYTSDTGSNITKIIIPIDIFRFFIKIPKKIFSFFSKFISKNNIQKENENLNNNIIKKFEKQKVVFVVHKGIYIGYSDNGASKNNLLFEKSLYYSDDINSYFNKYNLLHLDYSNYSSPDKNINWLCIKTVSISNSKVFFKTLLASLKTLYLIRSWSTFLGWVLCMQQYNSYLKYHEAIKKFKNLKVAIIDYDCLCPKPLILALEKNNIKTVATQERFITTFYTSFANVVLDTYYAASEYSAKIIKKSKYYDIKNIVPVGQYRSDYISLYKGQSIPEEISSAKKSGKKILVVLGHHCPNHWFESYTDPIVNWSAQISFLEDVIRLSQNLDNTFIILRYKVLDWASDPYFKNILNKINNCKNIVISNNYEESHYSYKLCANADLIIAKNTSLADECLVHEIPVLFHEYTHNMKKIIAGAFDYLSSGIICYDFEELLEKSKSLLFNSSNKLRDEITELNKKIYHVKEKSNIKNKVMLDCIRIIENS